MNGNLPTLSATVVAGAVLGALGVLLLIGGPSVDETKRFSKAPESRSLRVDEVISTSAESQRQDGYADIQSVADALALPDDFSRREALYVLAGRSNAAEVQDLVYQATYLVDSTQRYASVAILLERLVALDPRSAVAIAGGPRLSESRHFENAAWASWSRNDPEAAIAAAAALAGTARWRAVQGVYVGYGVSHVDAPGHILKATGVEPGRQAVANMVSLFAATDVNMAVEAIELLPRNPPIPYQAIGSLA